MNLEELKATWQEYDQKLVATRAIHEKIIMSMMREKSSSTLSKMRRMCIYTILLMGIIICFSLMSIIYNAFDYNYKIQFLPLILYVIVAAIFIVYLIREYSHANVDLYKENIKESLIKVIGFHKKFKSINLKLGVIFYFSGMLYLLSASIRASENQGILQALYFFLGGVVVSLGILFIAWWLGAFKDLYGNALENHLQELEEFEVEGKEGFPDVD